MRILKCEPEQIVNPYASGHSRACFENGQKTERKAWQAQLVDVDLDVMAVRWILEEVESIGEVLSGKIVVKGKSFTQFLKEQLESKQA